MTKMYLVRYSKIFLKSEPVRRRWENALISNIREVLPECRVRRERGRGRIWLEGAVDPEKLKRVFGGVSFSECEYCTLENLNSFSLDFCDEIEIDKARTFAVRVKRVGSHDFTSQQKAAELGDLILNKFKGLEVDLESSEKTIFVEIRNEDCYLFDEVIKGVGGIPLGVEGKLVALFSGGIDSPVAAWLMMKRGCKINPIYFDISPFSDKSMLNRAKRVANILKEYQPDFEIKVVKDTFLERAKEALKSAGIENYTCILCKRHMYRVAECIAKEEGAKGIVTGESLGQVASQTLDNLLVLDDACSLPVYRPLIGFDKVEIERIAQEIGTFDASILPASSCSAVPKKPVTKAKLEKVLEIEKELILVL